MIRTGLKRTLADGNLSIGSWLSWASLPTTEMMARAGFDWLVIDMEHTTIDFSQAMDMMMVIEGSGGAPLVRIGANDPLLIKRSMDAGAHGVIVPNVNSPEEARRAVESLYYPPGGKRGAGLGRAQAYGVGFDEYRAWLEEEAVLIVQIEHIKAVEQIGDILEVDGVDGFLVGPYDLSASIGKPGAFDDNEVASAFAAVGAAMKSTSKTAGIHVVQPDLQGLKDRIGEGYRFIAYGADMIFFATALESEKRSLEGIAGT